MSTISVTARISILVKVSKNNWRYVLPDLLWHRKSVMTFRQVLALACLIGLVTDSKDLP